MKDLLMQFAMSDIGLTEDEAEREAGEFMESMDYYENEDED